MVTKSKLSLETVREAIPIERRGYVEAAFAMRDNEPTRVDGYGRVHNGPTRVTLRGLTKAVFALAYSADDLQPPMPGGIAEIITDLADEARAEIERYSHFSYDYQMHRAEETLRDRRDVAELAVLAAFDNGQLNR